MSLLLARTSASVGGGMTRPPRLIQFLALAACALAAKPIAQASITRAMDLAELTEGADQIVVADVVSTECAWDKDHRNIYSTIEINVRERWKGTIPGDGRIKIRQLGGTVGDIEMTVYGMPSFEPGERALLFLRHAGVVGMGQGKRRVHWDPIDKQWLADGPDRTRLLSVGGNGKARATKAGQSDILERLREQVRTLVGD